MKLKLRIKQTDKDKAIGYKWIELTGEAHILFSIADGKPKMWIMVTIKNNHTESSDWNSSHYHSSIPWEDIEKSIEQEEYIIEEMDWPLRSNLPISLTPSFVNGVHHV